MVDWVVQLGVGVAELLAIDKEFETFGQILIVTMAFAQRRHLDRVVAHKGRLDQISFAILAEDGIDQLAFAHCVVDLDVESFAGFAQLLLALAGDVVAGLFADGIGHRHPAEWSLE